MMGDLGLFHRDPLEMLYEQRSNPLYERAIFSYH